MTEFKNIEGLPQEARTIFLPVLRRMVEAAGQEITTVFLYGSSTGRNFIPKASDVNSVVVVRAVTPELLEKILRAIGRTRNKRVRAPLVLTEEHIRSSLDVFPVEFLEMKDNYTVLYGNDLLKDVVVEDRHARLFCEQQIKGKLIRIRQAYLERGSTKGALEILLKESLNTLIPVFRTLLRLKKVLPPMDKGMVLEKVSEIFGTATAAMTLIWQDKKNDRRISGRDVHEVFSEYIQELEHLAQAVDRL